MKHLSKSMAVGSIGLLLLMTACSTNNQATPQNQTNSQTHNQTHNQTHTQSANHPAHLGHNGETVIPSVDRDKKLTTNNYGTTFSGMGTSVYSNIGSSNLHGGGPSTNLDSRLNAAGIHGVQTLIVNDVILVAPATANTTSVNHMDPMQSHLLSSFSGSSSRGGDYTGEYGNHTAGTMGTSDQHNTLMHARKQIERIYGSDVQVLTVTSNQGLQAFEHIKRQMRENKRDDHTIGQISNLLREANRQP